MKKVTFKLYFEIKMIFEQIRKEDKSDGRDTVNKYIKAKKYKAFEGID